MVALSQSFSASHIRSAANSADKWSLSGGGAMGATNCTVSVNGTAYTAGTTGTSETVTLGTNSGGNDAVTIGGTGTAGDVLTVTTFVVTITGAGASVALQYDANGNMTSDGVNTYAWDAENRLIQINYPGTGNNSQFSYDAFGRCVNIVEVAGGSVTSTKQFVWCGDEPCEVRDASGALLNQYFARRQVNFSGGVGTSYFYTLDHLGSVREMANSSGSVVYQQSFAPYGQPTALVNTTAADFGYAGYYLHAPSGLCLTRTRAYSAILGRFVNRDPIGEAGGVNLFAYTENNPVNLRDPSGLKKFCLRATKNKSEAGCVSRCFI